MEILDNNTETQSNEKNKLKSDEDVFSKPQLPSQLINEQFKQPLNIKTEPQQVQKCEYQEPSWSCKPTENYYFECIKSGTQLDNINLNDKSFYVVGRYYSCDIQLEHPSLSRFHAVFQYTDGEQSNQHTQKGFYIYDLNSTHGTFVNKKKIESKQYIFLKIGSCIKFGGSTRLFILNGPENANADDLNINLTHEQMKTIKEKYSKIALKLKIQKEIEEEEAKQQQQQGNVEKVDDDGIDWGMNNDANEDKPNADAAYLANITFNTEDRDESYYSSDPKKALRIFFEREGEEVEYECEEIGYGRFKCRIRLPVDNEFGEPMYAEVLNFEGKKKECQAQCALEACRILDAMGVLRGTGSKNLELKRKVEEVKQWESQDYYDDDDDLYLDRTGDVERKRLKRMKNFGKSDESVGLASKQKVLTFDSLKNDYEKLSGELIEINEKLDKCKNIVNAVQNDDVDEYINLLKKNNSNKMDIFTRTKLKRRVIDINQELNKLDKLLIIAKPFDFDLVKWKSGLVDEIKNANKKAQSNEIDDKKVICKVNSDELQVKVEPVVNKSVNTSEVKEVVVKKVEKPPESAPVESENSHFKKLIISENEKIPSKKQLNTKNKEDTYDYPTNDIDYSMWLPPMDQSGDGKTKLNEKYGY